MFSPTSPNATLVSKIIQQAVTEILSTSFQPVDVTLPTVKTIQFSSVSSVNKLGQRIIMYKSTIQYNVSSISDSISEGLTSASLIQNDLNTSVSNGKLLLKIQTIAINNYSSSMFVNVTLPSIQLSPVQTKVGHTAALSNSSATPVNTSIIIPVIVAGCILLLLAIAVYFYMTRTKKEEGVLIIGEDHLDFGRDYQGALADMIHTDDSDVGRQSIDGLDANDVRASINPFAHAAGDSNTQQSFFSSVLSSVSHFTGATGTSMFSSSVPGALSIARPSTSIRQPVARSPKPVAKSNSAKRLALNEAAAKSKVPPKPKNRKLTDCNVEQIQVILDRLNLSKYVSMFIENNIDGRILNEIETIDDLKSCGVSMPIPVMRAFLREIGDYQKKGVPDL